MAGWVYRRPWDFQQLKAKPWPALSRSAVLSGTVTTSILQADIRAGGKTIILTLTGDEWVPTASFDAQRAGIIAGLTSAQNEALGWNNVVKVLQGVAGVIRTSDTVVTITLDAQITYTITAQETITVTIPAAATLSGSAAIVASPVFTVDPVAATDVIPLWQQISFGSFQTYGLRV